VGLFFIIKGVGNLILDLLFVCTRACWLNALRVFFYVRPSCSPSTF
jgi:hypothetical protein